MGYLRNFGALGLVFGALVPLQPAAAQELVPAQPRPSYDAAKSQLVRKLIADEKVQKARLDRARAALDAQSTVAELAKIGDELSLLGLEIAVDQATANLKTAQERVEEAEAAYYAVRDRADLDYNDPLKLQAETELYSARGDIVSAENELQTANYRLNFRGRPLEDITARANEARREFETASAELAATQEQLARLLPEYLAELLTNPPPYLEQVDVKVGGTAVYSAEWKASPVSSDAASGEVAAELRARIDQLEAAMANERATRLELVARLEEIQPRLNELSGQAAEWREWGAYAAIALDSIGTFVGVYSSGGATGLVELWKSLASKNVAAAKIFEVGAGKAGSDDIGKMVSSYVDSRKPTDPTLGTTVTNTALAGGQVLLGDTIELAIASAPTAAYVAATGGLGAGLSTYASNFRSGLLVSALTAVAKSGAVAMTEYFASEVEREYNTLAIEAASLMFTLEQSRRDEATQREALRESVIALNRSQLYLGGEAPTVNFLLRRDEPARDEGMRREIRAELLFSQGLTVAPVVAIAGFEAKVSAMQGSGGRKWLAVLPGLKDGDYSTRVPLLVSLAPDNRSYAILDAQPASSARFVGAGPGWARVQGGEDTTHIFRVQRSGIDLAGIWSAGDRLIEHDGDRVVIRYRQTDPIVAVNAGDIDFEGTLSGLELVGTKYTYPNRSNEGCPGPRSVPANWGVDIDSSSGLPYAIRGAIEQGYWVVPCEWVSTGIGSTVYYKEL